MRNYLIEKGLAALRQQKVPDSTIEKLSQESVRRAGLASLYGHDIRSVPTLARELSALTSNPELNEGQGDTSSKGSASSGLQGRSPDQEGPQGRATNGSQGGYSPGESTPGETQGGYSPGGWDSTAVGILAGPRMKGLYDTATAIGTAKNKTKAVSKFGVDVVGMTIGALLGPLGNTFNRALHAYSQSSFKSGWMGDATNSRQHEAMRDAVEDVGYSRSQTQQMEEAGLYDKAMAQAKEDMAREKEQEGKAPAEFGGWHNPDLDKKGGFKGVANEQEYGSDAEEGQSGFGDDEYGGYADFGNDGPGSAGDGGFGDHNDSEGGSSGFGR